ncbi:MAG: phosphatidate cytidylyltransferase [Myxococcota bacterium]
MHPRPPSYPATGARHWRPGNLTLRLLTAAVLVPPVIWVCWSGGLAFVATVIAFALAGTHEFYNFIEAKGARPHRMLGLGAVTALPLVAYVGDAFWATSLMTAVLLGAMVQQLAKARIREAIVSVSATFFGVVYVGWLLSHAVSLRYIHRDLAARYGEAALVGIPPESGFFFMMMCLTAAVLCDAGAYFVGRRFGRRKLAPQISPSKTVEGALGGILVGALGAVLMKVFFDALVPGDLANGLSLLAAGLFGIAIAASSILGDLIESVLKRDADLKDAGSILPGVGGVLDRIDSALIAIPVTYYLLLAYYYVRLGF